MDWNSIFTMIHAFWVLWLMAIMIAIAFWAFRPKSKKRFEDDAMIIFRNPKNHGGDAHD